MKVAVVTFPGSNCDQDCVRALELAGGFEPVYRWHQETSLGDVAAVFLPGGFSYGDYLRSGAIARFSPIMEAVREFAREGGPVAGICNGFQVLCESGLLPGALLRNQSLKFRHFDVHIRVETTDTPFTSGYRKGEVLRIPIAHADGNYTADPQTLAELEGTDRIVFRYATPEGKLADRANPNGSAHHIAGIVNEGRNVLGMMPHPERAVEPLLGSVDGAGLFHSLRAHLGGAPLSSSPSPALP
ncbi:MAG: phosphoribosylformylglycinamidine synthase subunit PurQ [Gemmatimonadales bacterium]|nr:MAG: phosphoribosylformylglycinamidine synthase subunit PurQ [Gemmatimonadales bacterium]